MDKKEASLLLASYLDTLGYNNGLWEFNYGMKIYDLNSYCQVWITMIHEYLILGAQNIDISKWSASDDTVMILATAQAINDNSNYKKYYLKYYDTLKKRDAGITTIDSLSLLKINKPIDSKSNMGGNGCAMRTGPIGLKWHNNIEKVIEESISASILTHNYYIGYLGGMVTALFTAFALNKIPVEEWCMELINLYDNKIIHKYFPKEQNIDLLTDYINYWKKYQENRINKLQFKYTSNNFKFPTERTKFLLDFNPKSNNRIEFDYGLIGSSGIDACIYAYDCLLISNNDWSIFTIMVAIHPGDNDTTGAIGGTWFGALNGFPTNFNKDKFKELEFYDKLISTLD